MSKDFSRLKQLLQEQETFPTTYLHKFIGKNSEAFRAAVHELEKRYPRLVRKGERLSGDQNHLALTFEMEADSADEIVVVVTEIHALTDVVFVL